MNQEILIKLQSCKAPQYLRFLRAEYACYNIPLAKIACNTNIASGVRSAAFAQLAALLGYWDGVTSWKWYADEGIQAIMNAHVASDGYFTDTSGATWFRPMEAGGVFTGWDPSNFAATNSWISDFVDSVYGMPPEYRGIIPTNQETDFTALAALCLYNAVANGITNACGSGTTTGSVTVETVDQNNNPITGYYVGLYNNGRTLINHGFSPVTFSGLSVGTTYSVEPDNYGSCTFNHWQDTGSTVRDRSFTAASSQTFTAVYDCT